jgi:hypothetical protein
MKVGITGHQNRRGIQWSWVKDTIRAELRNSGRVHKALSSLAAGSDQVFAGVALGLGIPVVAVVPLDGYERFFEGPALVTYRRLLDQCELIQLTCKVSPERAFFEAGKFIVDSCDLLFAVWDGASAEGLGGTGDVVGYAQHKRRPVVHINPFNKTVRRI